MKRRKPWPPRVRKLYAEHRRLGMPPADAIKWAWILSKLVRDRDYYGFTSVRPINSRLDKLG